MIHPPPPVDPFQAPAAPAAGAGVKDAATSAPQRAPLPQDEESVRQAVAAINRAAKALSNSVQLDLDSSTGRALVRVVDSETGQLIRQIPSEEVLELRRALDRIA